MLLDAGGERAVTIRAIASAVGVSHNAPYKHFKDRQMLLNAVAIRDFDMLTGIFVSSTETMFEPIQKLLQALEAFIKYSTDSPARYRLLFNKPATDSKDSELEAAAMRSFDAFGRLVARCQTVKDLPDIDSATLAGLLYASVHGLIDIQGSGRMHSNKGFNSVGDSMALLLKLLSPNFPNA